MASRDAWLPPKQCIRLANRFGNWFTGPTLIYHRDRLLAVGGFDQTCGAPADLFTALTLASLHGAHFSPEPFAAIRVHGDSYSSRALKDVARAIFGTFSRPKGVDSIIPRACMRVRLAVAFLLLRPFEVFPTLFQRIMPRVINRFRFIFPAYKGGGSRISASSVPVTLFTAGLPWPSKKSYWVVVQTQRNLPRK